MGRPSKHGRLDFDLRKRSRSEKLQNWSTKSLKIKKNPFISVE